MIRWHIPNLLCVCVCAARWPPPPPPPTRSSRRPRTCPTHTRAALACFVYHIIAVAMHIRINRTERPLPATQQRAAAFSHICCARRRPYRLSPSNHARTTPSAHSQLHQITHLHNLAHKELQAARSERHPSSPCVNWPFPVIWPGLKAAHANAQCADFRSQQNNRKIRTQTTTTTTKANRPGEYGGAHTRAPRV